MLFRDTLERVLFLRKVAQLGNLPAGPLSALGEAMRERTFTAGSLIIPPQDGKHRDLVIVASGTVALTHKGEAAWTTDEPHALNFLFLFVANAEVAVKAVTDATVLLLPAIALRDVLEDSFEVTALLLRNRAAFIASGGLKRFALRLEEREDDDVALPLEDDLVSRILALRAISPIREMELDAIANIARVAKRVDYTRGDSVFVKGEPSQRIVLVLSGLLELSDPESKETSSAGAGAAVGVLDVLAAAGYWFDAKAGAGLATLEVAAEDLFDILEDHAESSQRLLAFFAELTLRIFTSSHEESQRVEAQKGAA